MSTCKYEVIHPESCINFPSKLCKQISNNYHLRAKSLASINPSSSSQQYHLPTMSDTKSLIPVPAPTPPFPLLKLPSEIRNRIWTLVVKVDAVVIRRDNYRKRPCEHTFATTMALAFTSRQMYHEVTPIYYSKNLFHFPYESRLVLSLFAEAIGPTNTESITRVGFARHRKMSPRSRGLRQALSPFPNLKVLAYFDLVDASKRSKPLSQIISHPATFYEWPTGRDLKAPCSCNELEIKPILMITAST